jgi:hypothetical protein
MGANDRKLAPSPRANLVAITPQALQKNPARPAIDLQTPVTLPCTLHVDYARKSPQIADFSGREKTSEPVTH